VVGAGWHRRPAGRGLGEAELDRAVAGGVGGQPGIGRGRLSQTRLRSAASRLAGHKRRRVVVASGRISVTWWWC
jgi:hypothetical protein